MDKKLSAMMAEAAELKSAITSPGNFVTKRFIEIKEKK